MEKKIVYFYGKHKFRVADSNGVESDPDPAGKKKPVPNPIFEKQPGSDLIST